MLWFLIQTSISALSPSPPSGLPRADSAQPFAVQVRNGRSVAVWPGFDAAELARLLAVVEDEGC
jgi:hypothetical protein